MPKVSFEEGKSRLETLHGVLGGRITPNRLFLSSKEAKGMVFKYDLEEGLGIECGQVILNEDYTFFHPPQDRSHELRVLFWLSNISIQFEDWKRFDITEPINITHSADMSYSITLPKKKQFSYIELCLEKSWFLENFDAVVQKMPNLKAEFDPKKTKNFFVRPFPPLMQRELLRYLTTELLEETKLLFLKGGAYMLLSVAVDHGLRFPKKAGAGADLFSDMEIQQKLQSVLQYIDDQIHEKLTLEEIAKEFALSKSSLQRAFKSNLGESIYDYILKERIRKVKVQLQDHRIHISEIAINCGFHSVSHLSATFKKRVGLSPQNYRNLLKSHRKI
ncbi:helix-turn-helix transcriptional regulator [Sediminitomix flava]|uniref:AraC-like DNA-binding protein n=1 Tax=Sediminitomix flava TaxID=379075 RepID=A0A315ZB13_SEDFL|nr:AraC family transcriptional regulator [Sediminitomix flava]PWJ42765.1 AraC-like DNA-binding protein [Sediminitomix flava]